MRSYLANIKAAAVNRFYRKVVLKNWTKSTQKQLWSSLLLIVQKKSSRGVLTAQQMKFFIMVFFSKFDQIRSFLASGL